MSPQNGTAKKKKNGPKKNGPKNGGRPTKLNDIITTEKGEKLSVRDVICSVIEEGGSQAEAALIVGMDATTLSRCKKRYADFAEDLTRARARFVIFHLRNIRAHSTHDWKASEWLLAVTYPERFSRRENLHHTGELTLIDRIRARHAERRKAGPNGR